MLFALCVLPEHGRGGSHHSRGGGGIGEHAARPRPQLVAELHRRGAAVCSARSTAAALQVGTQANTATARECRIADLFAQSNLRARAARYGKRVEIALCLCALWSNPTIPVRGDRALPRAHMRDKGVDWRWRTSTLKKKNVLREPSLTAPGIAAWKGGRRPGGVVGEEWNRRAVL